MVESEDKDETKATSNRYNWKEHANTDLTCKNTRNRTYKYAEQLSEGEVITIQRNGKGGYLGMKQEGESKVWSSSNSTQNSTCKWAKHKTS